MELGELDVPALATAITSGDTEQILQHQWDLLADLYNNINQNKLPPKQAIPKVSSIMSQSHLGTKTQKRREMPKIQSSTPKKGRKSNKQLIQELGAYLIDSGQKATLDQHFQPQYC